MHEPVTALGSPEWAAALLQMAILLALAALSGWLHRQYRKPYLAWWTAAWGLYALRVMVILVFLTSGAWGWLYGHQVMTGWTALALLGAALAFEGGGRRPRAWFVALWLFPPLWSYLAIYVLDDFLLAAGPAVAFLSLATLRTAWAFVQHRRRTGSGGAALLAWSFALWGLHHLDYPFLRARGAWVPWGYYLDIAFALAAGFGLLLLVGDELRRGVDTMAGLAADLTRAGRPAAVRAQLLERPLTLPALRGSALVLAGHEAVVGGAGTCAAWVGHPPAPAVAAMLEAAMREGRPVTGAGDEHGMAAYAYAAALPLPGEGGRARGALVLVADARDPFTALDETFLAALARQVGAALENADLVERLAQRSRELERLSARMVEQHEEERRRLSRELHDETAQLFSAVKMELGLLRSAVPAAAAPRLARALALVDAGIRSIRDVVRDLRPSLLDDLGLLPALRSLATDVAARGPLEVTLALPEALPPLSRDAELALFRALQEALANVVRHSGARRVDVALAVDGGAVRLLVRDDGAGPAESDPVRLEAAGHMGLAGMRERIGALGGTVRFGPDGAQGARLDIWLPPTAAEVSA